MGYFGGRLSLIFCAIAYWLLCSPSEAQSEFRTFTSSDGKKLEARVDGKTDESVTLIRRKDSKKFTIPLTRLSPADRDYLKEWTPKPDEEKTSAADSIDWSQIEKRYYPRTLEELRAGFEEIEATPKGDYSDDVHFSFVELNMFRFGCIVPLAKLDPKLTEQAEEAAKAVEAHGSLSHTIGHYTNVCSLGGAKGTGKPETAGFINDRGENNRRHRGHRLNALHYQMEKTGFAFSDSGDFFAQRVQSYTGKKPRKPYAYPGMGLYPLSRLRGNGWSLYLPEAAPAASKISVKIWKLIERPKKRIGSGQEPIGEELEVEWISVERFAINFEPSSVALNDEPAVYFVRVTGGGVREDYVVDLFDDEDWPCKYSGRE